VGGSAAIVPEDLYGRTKVLVTANATLYTINFDNGAILNVTRLTGMSALQDHCTPTVVGNDFVFTETGAGSVFGPTVNSKLSMFNATTMELINQVTLDLGSGSTPTFESPAYIPNLRVELKNGTNIGYNTTNSEVAQKYILNQSETRAFNVVIAVEAQYVAEWAIIANGTNLGTQSSPWIVNCSTPYYMVRLWGNWVGHQALASPVVAINSQTPGFNAIVYEGNSVYGFTAYNCSSGAILSTFTATAQVFTTPALYQSRVYMTDSAGILHCFISSEPEFSVPTPRIYASSNKGEEMFSGETMLVEGQLTAEQIFDSPLVSPETFNPPLPYTSVHFTYQNPGGSTIEQTTTTDANGHFNFSITPTELGKAQWLAFFDGMQTLNGQYMNQAYMPWTTITVTSQGGGGTPTPTPSGGGGEPVPMEYIIIAIVVAVIIIAVVVGLALRSRRK
jgi:hypothetical protein